MALKMNIKTWKIAAAAALTGLLATSTSCVDDNSECIPNRPGYTEGNDVWLQFRITNAAAEEKSGMASRAGEDTGGHPEEESSAAENHLNLDECRLMLLNDQRRVIKEFDRNELTMIDTNGDHRDYKLVAKVNKQYFDYAQGEQIGMSLMLVANTDKNSNTNGLPAAGDILWKMSAEDIAKARYSFEHTYGSWEPEIGKEHIPMGGLQHYTISRSALEAATTQNEAYDIDGTLQEKNMYVQRSIAKIRVIDAIEDEAYGIASVSLTGGNTKGAYVPDFTLDGAKSWANGTVDIEKATDVGAWSATSTVVLTSKGEWTLEDGTKYRNHLTGYMPEWEYNPLANQEPTLKITTEDNESWTLRLRTDLGVSSFVRNHIYEFTVTRNLQGDVVLQYIVCPWRPYVVDIPTFD